MRTGTGAIVQHRLGSALVCPRSCLVGSGALTMPVVVSLNVSGYLSLTLNDEKRTAWLLGERLNARGRQVALEIQVKPSWTVLSSCLLVTMLYESFETLLIFVLSRISYE